MPILEALTQIYLEALADGLRGFPLPLSAADAYAALGQCAFRLGRFAESAAHRARAEAASPDGVEFRLKRQFAALRARGAD